jgi:hypothetical protein
MLAQPERWRTLVEAHQEPPVTNWTTCLMHAEHGDKIHVCSRPAGHMEEAALEDRWDFHMDLNSSMAWTSPLDVWEIKPETRWESWRAWLYMGTLDRRSMLVGMAAVLLAETVILLVVSVTLAAIYIPH